MWQIEVRCEKWGGGVVRVGVSHSRELTWVESMVHFEVYQVRKALPQQQPVHGGFPPHVTVTVPRLAVPTATVLQAELVHVL